MQVAAIGECMIELSSAGQQTQGHTLWQQGFAGDTNNTATYLSRLLAPQGHSVHYVTALGDDHFSSQMIELWQQENLGTGYVQHIQGLLPGLYAIRTEAGGERHFSYWRSQAAARHMMDAPGAVLAAIEACQTIYLSGITLAILPDDARKRLIDALGGAKRIVFDPNYRPVLWSDPAKARACFNDMYSIASIALPTFDDEKALFGDPSPDDTIKRICAQKTPEIVVKCGAEPAMIQFQGERSIVASNTVENVIDTTGAGDSFNAGYIAARLMGQAPKQAALAGHTLASVVIANKGAIIQQSQMPANLDFQSI